MGTLDETRFIERQQFFNGQRLLAADLQGLESFNREMRWLHNRSLHQPGVGSGLAVFGEREDREVRVMPGYALDSLGREIVLIEPEIMAVPPVAGDENGGPAYFYLAIAYPREDDLEEAETRQGLCDTAGTVRLQEKPVLCWIRLKKDGAGNFVVVNGQFQAEINQGRKIVLARAEVMNCQLNKSLSVMERRNARVSCLPYIDCGVALPVQWEMWWSTWEGLFVVEDVDDDDFEPALFFAARIAEVQASGPLIFGIKATIDTSAAGFSVPPSYTVRIAGSRLVDRPVIPGLHQAQGTRLLYQENVSIGDVTTDSFTIYAALVVAPLRGDLIELNRAVTERQQQLAKDVEAAGGDEDVIAELVSAAKAELDQYILSEWIPDDWQVVWMGVEG